jgi:hypothetical protein
VVVAVADAEVYLDGDYGLGFYLDMLDDTAQAYKSIDPDFTQMLGGRMMGTAATVALTLAMADGPLPVGDAIGAAIVGAVGLYLWAK